MSKQAEQLAGVVLDGITSEARKNSALTSWMTFYIKIMWSKKIPLLWSVGLPMECSFMSTRKI